MWTVIFRNRSFWLQIQIPCANPVLGAEFHKSRSKAAIVGKEMPIFLTNPVDIFSLPLLSALKILASLLSQIMDFSFFS